jgi:hypothetical protein
MFDYRTFTYLPGFSQPFIVACDASTKALGAVLSQIREGEESPVAYCSRQLNSAESKYSVTELELLEGYENFLTV